MSIPINRKSIEKLQAMAEENKKAGDWLYETLPGSDVPIPIDGGLTPEHILGAVGNLSVPRKTR